MGFFKLGKKDRVIDLSERYRVQKQKSLELQNKVEPENISQEPAAPMFPFFNSDANPTEPVETVDPDEANERKRKLAKRLMDITSKIEELSNQIYHLTQRVEVIEKRTRGQF